MAMPAADQRDAAVPRDDDPVTLHRVIQTMIGEGLRERYQAPQRLSHGLLVLLLQLKEQERKGQTRTSKAPGARQLAGIARNAG